MYFVKENKKENVKYSAKYRSQKINVNKDYDYFEAELSFLYRRCEAEFDENSWFITVDTRESTLVGYGSVSDDERGYVDVTELQNMAYTKTIVVEFFGDNFEEMENKFGEWYYLKFGRNQEIPSPSMSASADYGIAAAILNKMAHSF